MPNIIVPSSLIPNATFTITLSGGPGNPLDWVGFYLESTVPDNGNYLQWQFLNGTQISPTVGLTNASLQFIAPTIEGVYNIRWFATGGYTRIAISSPIIVGPSTLVVINGDSNTSHDYATGLANWTEQAFPGCINLATSGKKAIKVLEEAPLFNGNLGIVMIGTNDMAADIINSKKADQSRNDYLIIMRQIILALKPRVAHLIIVSPPFSMHPIEVVRFPTWIEGLHNLCAEFDVKFIDFWNYMRALSNVLTPEQFDIYYRVPGIDKYHLSDAGHTLLAKRF